MVGSSCCYSFAWYLPLVVVTTFLFLHSAVKCECLVDRNPSVRITPASREELHPPLILLGGIAQTKTSWDHHLLSLARNRKVLVYECLGQGENMIPEDSDVDASLPAQAQLLLDTLNKVLLDEDDRKEIVAVDVAGFSFGGRVAMAATCLQSDNNDNDNGVRIRRLHLTGIGGDRSNFGYLAMKSFPDIIRGDSSLRSFAWSILLATYSSSYLRSLPESTLERFLDHIAASNKPDGLLAIIAQAEVSNKEDPWHVVNMARRLTEQFQSQSNPTTGKLCVGEFDKMAPVEAVEYLSENNDWILSKVDILPDCGHAVVLEKPRDWRESVLSFLDEDTNV